MEFSLQNFKRFLWTVGFGIKWIGLSESKGWFMFAAHDLCLSSWCLSKIEVLLRLVNLSVSSSCNLMNLSFDVPPPNIANIVLSNAWKLNWNVFLVVLLRRSLVAEHLAPDSWSLLITGWSGCFLKIVDLLAQLTHLILIHFLRFFSKILII